MRRDDKLVEILNGLRSENYHVVDPYVNSPNSVDLISLIVYLLCVSPRLRVKIDANTLKL
jgi:hypothetical protein